MRAKFTERVLYGWDFEPFGTPEVYGGGGTNASVRSTARYAGLTDTSHTVPLPPGWAVGDLCYIAWSMATTLSTALTLTVPSGWTQVITQFAPSGVVGAIHGVLRRVLQAGDGSVTLSHTNSRLAAVSVAVTGNAVVSEDVTPASDNNSGVTGANVRAPSLTPVTSADLLLTFHAVRNNSPGVVTSIKAPTGMIKLNEISSAHKTHANTAIQVSQQMLSGLTATGTKIATASASNITNINRQGSSILIRSLTPPSASLDISGGFAWKHIAMTGPQLATYDCPGTNKVSIQWCAAIIQSNGTPITVDATPAMVTTQTGTATTATFNVPVNTMIAALIGYNADQGDTPGNKITVTNNKSLVVTKIVERAHGDGESGGCAIAYMYSTGAQTGMTVTATATGVNVNSDDVALKVLLLGNTDTVDPMPDGVFEGTSYGNMHYLTARSELTSQGIALWAMNDWFDLGSPAISELNWGARFGTSLVKTATSPISGQQSLLNTWTIAVSGIQFTMNNEHLIDGPKNLRISFKFLGTETVNPSYNPKISQSNLPPGPPRLELEYKDVAGRVFKRTSLGFPSNVLRDWSSDFFIPAGVSFRSMTIWMHGWDTSAAARVDDIKITELMPEYVRFRRVTDGGYVRGGNPAQAVRGVAYAFDDELVPNQPTEWSAEPVYNVSDPQATVYGPETGTVGFTIEDRPVTLPSTLIKSVEDAGLRMYLSTDQRQITKSRSTTFVNKQTTGKPAGGVNSAYSLAGDWHLITRTIQEMRDLMTILDETVLYISPTGRYNKIPFYATVMEYTIHDFATMDDQHKTFAIRFQEVERPDTEGQPNFLPLADYKWLAEQYSTYSDPALTSLTYDQLAFSAVP